MPLTFENPTGGWVVVVVVLVVLVDVVTGAVVVVEAVVGAAVVLGAVGWVVPYYELGGATTTATRVGIQRRIGANRSQVRFYRNSIGAGTWRPRPRSGWLRLHRPPERQGCPDRRLPTGSPSSGGFPSFRT
jgi:hypothetical protein